MADKLTLVQYGGFTPDTTISPPCGKAHMALRAKGLAYETRNVGNPNEIKKYNTRGRVPVLLFGESPVADSSDIITELDRRYPDPPLEPEGPRERALVKVLEDWADEVLYFYLVWLRWCHQENFARLAKGILSKAPFPMGILIPPFARSVARKRARGQGVGLKDEATVMRELEECLRALDAMIEGDGYLVGPRLTRADISVCAEIDQLRLATLTPDGARLVERFPRIIAFTDRVHEKAKSAV